MKKVFLIFIGVAMSAMMLTSYGQPLKVSEASSKEVTIGNQVWMTKNLNVDKFRNGEPIPHAKTDAEWEQAGENQQPAWCYYDNDPANGDKYGKLYNWFAVNDSRGLAPEGWKIPSDEDWSRLTDFLGGESDEGKKMKFTDFWADNDGESGNGTNESGFSAFPGGYRNGGGAVGTLGYGANWWSSTEYSSAAAWGRALSYYGSSVLRYDYGKEFGFSVRCVRD